MVNKLKESSLTWSLRHILREGDTDLFPQPFEFELIRKNWKNILLILRNYDITNHKWKGFRKVLIPKDKLTFRSFCQLDPLDSILYAAIIKEIGDKIERRRIPLHDNRVFSYRFKPTADYRLYGEKSLWERFWNISKSCTEGHRYVLITDISDFYNQIYHHTIEQQLEKCKVDTFYITAIKNLITSYTQGISRGIPIGPYPSHLLAELSLIPIDESLKVKGYTFCRFVDDMHIFCESREECQIAGYDLASSLDTVKLSLAKHKTDTLSRLELISKAEQMLINNPINRTEGKIIRIIKGKTNDSYESIRIGDLSDDELKILTQDNIENILNSYINKVNPNYVRLRWFLRRLSQVGVPGGVDFIINNIGKFVPAIADAVTYINSAQLNYTGSWKQIGKQLLLALEVPIIKKNEYLQAVLLNLFTRITDLDNIEELIKNFGSYGNFAKRKIILIGIAAGASSWLREFKDKYSTFDPWSRRAIIFGASIFPKGERKFWLKQVRKIASALEEMIIDSINRFY